MTHYCAKCGEATEGMDHDEWAWAGGLAVGYIIGGTTMLVTMLVVFF